MQALQEQKPVHAGEGHSNQYRAHVLIVCVTALGFTRCALKGEYCEST